MNTPPSPNPTNVGVPRPLKTSNILWNISLSAYLTLRPSTLLKHNLWKNIAISQQNLIFWIFYPAALFRSSTQFFQNLSTCLATFSILHTWLWNQPLESQKFWIQRLSQWYKTWISKISSWLRKIILRMKLFGNQKLNRRTPNPQISIRTVDGQSLNVLVKKFFK